jgi:hypothetical protein
MDEDFTIALVVIGFVAGIILVCAVCTMNFRRTSIQEYSAIIP